MDKKEKGITIKINGAPKPFVEKKDVPIISENDEAAARESSDESFDWMLPNEMTPSPVPKKTNIYHKQRRKINLKAPIILAIAAVIFGTSLGLVVIRTITSEQTIPSVNESPKQNIPAVAPITESPTENITIQTFLVQGGVFSTKESAQEVQARIHEKNVPAEVFQVDKNYYVFLGAAESLETAKELAMLYKTYDIDVYWKEIELTTKLKKGEKEIEKLLSIYSSLAEISAAKLCHATSNVNANQVNAQLNEVQSSGHEQALGEAADLLQKNQPSEAQEKLLTFLQMIAE